VAALAAPSAFFVDQFARLRTAAAAGPIVDLACGRGRHTLPTARKRLPIVGVDRDRDRLVELCSAARGEHLRVSALCADLEAPAGFPLKSRSCGAILVFRYLHRPLAPAISDALLPGGVLVYETFASAQREMGWGPTNPAFLLQPGELPELFGDLEILESWEGVVAGPRPEAVGRLVARRRPHA